MPQFNDPVFGWYEQLRTPALEERLEVAAEAAPGYLIHEKALEGEDLRHALVNHLRPLFPVALAELDDVAALGLAANLVEGMAARSPELAAEQPNPQLIRALLDPAGVSPSQVKDHIGSRMPVSGFSTSTLFTGKERQFSLLDELRREIRSASRIDLVISFLRWSGLRLLVDELQHAVDAGVEIRVITTVYLGATEVKSILELAKLGAGIRISFNTTHGRLHAKAWIFHRPRGLGTAYVGSSNLSKDAVTDGLEWNVKAAERETPDLFARSADSFEALWVDPEFECWEAPRLPELQAALTGARQAPGTVRMADLPTELRNQVKQFMEGRPTAVQPESLGRPRPYAFQQEVLDRLEGERTIHGRWRNLVVLPTGTGKTVIAAFDYARQVRGRRPRLLFVAHREELLIQARRTFARVLGDPDFGEVWNARHEPEHWDHLFASVRTLHEQREVLRARWPEDHFDFLVVDEAHHGTAPGYRFLSEHFRPRILLGMTATPERMDNAPVAADYHGHFAAEVRLAEGIVRELLAPFHYFGVAAGVPDLSGLKWNGRYDLGELEDRLGGESFAQAVLSAISRVVAEPAQARSIGFCVGLHQAEYLAGYFQHNGLRADWISGDTPEPRRSGLLERLAQGDINYLFTVDLLNEGIDVPAVDTVLFLRPTESLTVFLQQLGRGLRLHPDKVVLTVLDFVGQSHRSYDFTHKFQAMLGVPRSAVRDQLRFGYPDLPPGCAIHLERQAEEIILQQIQSWFPNRRFQMITLVGREPETGFARFLERQGWTAEYLLSVGGLWYQMVAEHRGRAMQDSNREMALNNWVLHKLLTCDSPQLLEAWREALAGSRYTESADLLVQQVVVWGSKGTWGNADDTWRWLGGDPARRDELIDWMEWKLDRLESHGLADADQPRLRRFCSYDHKAIAWAQGRARYGESDVHREGVQRIKEVNDATLYWNLYVTVRKSEQEYSRQTQYRDWALTQEIFHWESPNNWVPEGGQGRRFLEEIEAGVPVFLFVREMKKDGWKLSPPYLYLGKVALINGTVDGRRPMAMQFRLPNALPMAHFRQFAHEAAG